MATIYNPYKDKREAVCLPLRIELSLLDTKFYV